MSSFNTHTTLTSGVSVSWVHVLCWTFTTYHQDETPKDEGRLEDLRLGGHSGGVNRDG